MITNLCSSLSDWLTAIFVWVHVTCLDKLNGNRGKSCGLLDSWIVVSVYPVSPVTGHLRRRLLVVTPSSSWVCSQVPCHYHYMLFIQASGFKFMEVKHFALEDPKLWSNSQLIRRTEFRISCLHCSTELTANALLSLNTQSVNTPQAFDSFLVPNWRTRVTLRRRLRIPPFFSFILLELLRFCIKVFGSAEGDSPISVQDVPCQRECNRNLDDLY
jgi:hypothetical protein